jgi:acetyl-CoA carboxylase biotin carboxyl carrier protein|nr:acetyl-CoA carboxylase biotin carboxyl carrier protein [Kofleriaceae bacterium]
MAKQGKAKPDEEDRDDSGEPSLVALVRGFAEIVATHGLTELVVDTKDTTLTLRRGLTMAAPMVAAAAPAQAPVHLIHSPPLHATHAASAPVSALAPTPPAPVDDKSHVVTSPFVGTFYRKPNPDSASYVSLHDKVDKGAVLCIIEAMKLMNEIEADVGGTVVAILVEDGVSVEYGQPLFKIAT